MIEHAISIPAEYSKAFQALLHLVEEYPRKVVIKVTGALSEPAVVTGTHHDTLLTIKGMESGKIGMFGVLPFLKALENNVALLLVCGRRTTYDKLARDEVLCDLVDVLGLKSHREYTAKLVEQTDPPARFLINVTRSSGQPCYVIELPHGMPAAQAKTLANQLLVAAPDSLKDLPGYVKFCCLTLTIKEC